MMRNAAYILDYIIDENNLAKPAQVGVDLTLNKVSLVGDAPDDDVLGGRLFNDETAARTGTKIDFARYTEVATTSVSHGGEQLEMFDLPRGVYSIEFDQGLNNLGEEDTAFIHHRSSVLRNGNIIRTAVYDPGFGTPAMGAFLFVFVPMQIERHARVAQIVIHSNEKAELYDGSYNNGKDFR